MTVGGPIQPDARGQPACGSILRIQACHCRGSDSGILHADLADKAIAAGRNSLYELGSGAVLAQGPAKDVDHPGKIAVLHDGVAPDRLHQLVLADQVSVALHQVNQRVEGLRRQVDRGAMT